MCKNGFRASKTLARIIARSESYIRQNDALADIFIDKKTNKTVQENDLIKMPNLAKTLELISIYNISAFYNSDLTRQMVKEINENGRFYLYINYFYDMKLIIF